MFHDDYAPLESPFELPVVLLGARCRTARELRLHPRRGSNLHTTLRGAFGSALVGVGCQTRRGAQTCLDRAGRRGCERPGACAVPWLHEPHVAEQRRDHPSPIVLRVADVDWEPGPSESALVIGFDVRLALLGRHARAERDLVQRGFELMGTRGLHEANASDPVPFEVEWGSEFVGTLADWLATRTEGQPRDRVILELATPLAADPPDFASLLGNLAHDLVQWDLADRGLATTWGADAKRRCDLHADRARALIAEQLSAIQIHGEIGTTSLGHRASRSTRGRFELAGYDGWLSLAGNLEPLLPWLVALELRGGGAKKSFGLGEVRLRW